MEYSELREKVARGAKFSIDFKKRTLKMNGVLIDVNYVEWEGSNMVVNPMRYFEYVYEKYKYSVPSERSEKRQRNYFYALPYEKLDDDQLINGERREYARFELEFAILFAIVHNKIQWQDDWGSWFWQSDTDKDFVILREWVEPQQDK